MRKKLLYYLYLVFAVTFILIVIEVYFNFLLNNPNNIKQSWLITFKDYYNHKDLEIIQYKDEMSQWDDKLFYRLKPGEFVFKNREFEDKYKVNSLGVRDDESSLKNPKYIFLGDSHTMGWGVKQDETFASLIERKLGEKVLNAGISSYGTVRELKLLEEINTDSLNYLFIQFCYNDKTENQQFFENNYQYKPSSKDDYNTAKKHNKSEKSYYLFKHLINIIPGLFNKKEYEIPVHIKNETYHELNFLNIIKNSKKIANNVKIIVFDVSHKESNNYFMDNFKELLNKEFGSTYHDRIHVVNIPDILSYDDYYILDGHLNKKGHQKIAAVILNHLKNEKKGREVKKWYYDNGNLSIEANYFNGLKQGKTTYYWPNGKISRISHFEEGYKTGLEINYDSTGYKLSEMVYK